MHAFLDEGIISQLIDEEIAADQCRQAHDRRLGWIYITDDKGTNPWDQLPSYWEEEVKELLKLNTTKKDP